MTLTDERLPSGTRRILLPDGVAAHAVMKGDGDGPVVIVLHGIASHLGWYERLAEDIAGAGARVWLVDRRGAGRSDGTRGHVQSWRELVADVETVIRQVADPLPVGGVHLVGISLGGVLSLATALAHPALVARQVILCPGLASRVRLPLVRRIRLLWRSITWPERLYDLPFSPDMLTERASWQQAIEQDPLRTRRVSARFLVEFFRMQRFVARNIARLRSPTACLLAERDAIIDNKVVLAILAAARCPVDLEMFAEAHHVLPASVPAELLRGRITDWLFGDAAPAPGLRRTPVETTADTGASGPLPPFQPEDA